MRFRIERLLEEIMLAEAGSFVELIRDVRNYEHLQRIAVQSPEDITEEELGAAKEAILERWPSIPDLGLALDATGSDRGIQMRRIINEGKQIPRTRPARVRETREQRLLRFSNKLTEFKGKAKDKKDKQR